MSSQGLFTSDHSGVICCLLKMNAEKYKNPYSGGDSALQGSNVGLCLGHRTKDIPDSLLIQASSSLLDRCLQPLLPYDPMVASTLMSSSTMQSP